MVMEGIALGQAIGQGLGDLISIPRRLKARKEEKESTENAAALRQAMAEATAMGDYETAAALAVQAGENPSAFLRAAASGRGRGGGGRGGGGGIDPTRIGGAISQKQADLIQKANDPNTPMADRAAASAQIDALSKVQDNIKVVSDTVDASLSPTFKKNFETVKAGDTEQVLEFSDYVEKQTANVLGVSKAKWDQIKESFAGINVEGGGSALSGIDLIAPDQYKNNAMMLAFSKNKADNVRGPYVKKILEGSVDELAEALKKGELESDPDLEKFAYQALATKVAAGLSETKEKQFAAEERALSFAGEPSFPKGRAFEAASEARIAAEKGQKIRKAIVGLAQKRRKKKVR